MLRHALIAGIATLSILLSPAVLATPAQTRTALAEAVERENWSLAVSLVDRLIDEQGVNQDLLTYRSRLQQLNTNSMLAELGADPGIRQVQARDAETALARELALERQRQTELAAREERLAAREARREQRNQERLQRAEERYLRALERESVARANAINARESRRTVCISSFCGYRRTPFIIDRDHYPVYDHHRTRSGAVYPGQVVRPGGINGPGVRVHINN